MARADRFVKSLGKTEGFDLKKYMDRYNLPGKYKDVRDYSQKHQLKELPGTAKMINLLRSSGKRDLWTMEIINSYDLWLFYSKYEHIGWFSHNLTRNFSEMIIEDRLDSILRKLLIMICGCLDELKEIDAYNLCKEILIKQYNRN